MPDLPITRQIARENRDMARMLWDDETSFIGRSKELDLIGTTMNRSRLVTLTGTGGVGKTRLAGRVTSLEKPRTDRDVAWADLSPLRNPQLLAATVAEDARPWHDRPKDHTADNRRSNPPQETAAPYGSRGGRSPQGFR
ncbi:hypothetical protein ACFV29_22290 [Streptomyces sp. NPDC059690]|uniref:hypothetical protein n=1 Tax=Streptomyces sp. NPDC059690 TaxID=3346907 RepID=UPI0036BCC972